jgi:DNA polymerase IV (DinB-like DNA polymerase)
VRSLHFHPAPESLRTAPVERAGVPTERLPGAPARERVVAHVDVDCFYAACERLREAELRGEPLVVGMGYEPGESHGAVATASYEAREHGVESAMAITEALELLPRRATADEDDGPTAYYRPVDMAYYESVAEEVKAVLHAVADTVREVSVDEAYLDVTESVGWNDAAAFADDLKARIHEEAGVVASVGVAPNMATAKVASDRDKPDGLVVVPPGEAADFLAPLPVEELHGVGPVTAAELRDRGVETAGDLAETDPAVLADQFGERGREIHRHARGVDDREVEPVGKPKSLSSESALVDPTDDPSELRDRVRALASEVADRASAKGALYRTIGIKFVAPPFAVNTRARSLPGPVDDPDLVEEVALDLVEEFAGDRRARKLGVRVSNLSFSTADQPSLDGWTDGDRARSFSFDGSDDGGQTSLEEFR